MKTVQLVDKDKDRVGSQMCLLGDFIIPRKSATQ